MMAFRFLMGVFETGYSPGVPYYLTFFYYRHEIAWRISVFCVAAPIATTFSGALAYGITKNTNLAIASWRVLFLVESLPTIALGLWGYYALPNSSADSRFLTEHEKNIAKARLARQISKVEMSRSFRVKDFLTSLIDPKVVLPMVMYFSINVSYSSLPVFTPAIIHGMGFTSVNSQGLSAIPYIYTTVIVLLSCYLSDRWRVRGAFVTILSLKGAVGWLLLALCKTTGVRYFALFLASSGIFSCVPLMLTWMSNNQGTEQKRGIGFMFINILGQTGPLVGTRLFPASEAPLYIKGCWISFGFTVFLSTCSVVLALHLIYENRKLERKYGPAEDTTQASNSVSEDGEVNPNFRYIW
ncbi:Tna1p [Sugiyamaella lignohabitans]|uniref:Tna1p n=1 Tax=Sugiyamaella lignohabitans TaxID=796027 RepID=A0A167EZG3_9ASCO|nr:Tna1p [Sugiyamaella lignohabitans]ANB14639.1 Tna1p [Sugiyamaella lignohabitans]